MINIIQPKRKSNAPLKFKEKEEEQGEKKKTGSDFQHLTLTNCQVHHNLSFKFSI